MKLCFHSTLQACFSSRLHCPEFALISPHGFPQHVVGTIETCCMTTVTSAGSGGLRHKSLPMLSCSGFGTHFYWSQNGLRMDYGLTIYCGVKTANGSLR